MNIPEFFTMSLQLMADSSGAIAVMREYVYPTIRMLASLASVAVVFFLVYGGYGYITSRGNPESLENAKRIIRNALIGLVMVIASATLVSVLSNAYGAPAGGATTSLPSLQAIEPADVGNGLVDVLIRAVTGFLNNIIQAVGAPFLAALDYFTKETPLMAENSSVFNLWLAVVGITNVLLIIIVALLGFHVMSATTFGFDEIEFKHLLPRIGLAFLLLNSSIFIIDAIIELSNVLITAISKVSGSSSVWQTLSSVVSESGGQSAAALLIMLAFLIVSVVLMVYYVGRIVTLFIGAVLSPLVIMIWLIPGFRDFSSSAVRTYITTIFVLFVHVVTLQLASSLFTGMSATSGEQLPNTLMSMVVGLATVLVLLKTQGVMMQFSYVSMGARNARKLGSQFMNGISYMQTKGRSVVASKATTGSTGRAGITAASGGSYKRFNNTSTYRSPSVSKSSGKQATHSSNLPTGTTYAAPKPTPRTTVIKSTPPTPRARKDES